jgi:hypothetical protein
MKRRQIQAYTHKAKIPYLISEEDEDLLQKTWFCMQNGYIATTICIDGKSKIKTLHRIIAERMGILNNGLYVDHINRDKKDNRRENLRAVTPRVNTLNQKIMNRNKTGVRGVCWYEGRKKWKAEVCHNYRHYVKNFSNFDDAVKWREQKFQELHGDCF